MGQEAKTHKQIKYHIISHIRETEEIFLVNVFSIWKTVRLNAFRSKYIIDLYKYALFLVSTKVYVRFLSL